MQKYPARQRVSGGKMLELIKPWMYPDKAEYIPKGEE